MCKYNPISLIFLSKNYVGRMAVAFIWTDRIIINTCQHAFSKRSVSIFKTLSNEKEAYIQPWLYRKSDNANDCLVCRLL